MPDSHSVLSGITTAFAGLAAIVTALTLVWLLSVSTLATQRRFLANQATAQGVP